MKKFIAIYFETDNFDYEGHYVETLPHVLRATEDWHKHALRDTKEEILKDIESELNEFYLPSREGLDPQVERFEDRIVITDECQICTYLIKELNF